jgi:class 3 adenylate cyclase/ATP/maltotriose-dependent transcriptional regulator MalT
MFCDLVESTRLSLELDAEDFTTAVSAYRDLCARIIRRWRGYTSRYVGDGVLIYFGYPRAAEDDALRGVAAAWELAQAIPQLAFPQSPAGTAGGWPRLQARISLHTGLTVVGDVVGRESVESDGALGAVPNIAAKLQSLAGPGEVVVSDTTAAMLPPSVGLRPLDQVGERSDYGAVRAFVVTGVPPGLLPARPVSAAALVGRQDALERLLARLRARSELAAVYVHGDAGVGKSRLVREVMRHEEVAAAAWVRLGCSAYGQASPLHPFGEWLGAIDEPSPEVAAGGAPVATTPFDRRRRTFDRLRTELLSRGERVGLVVEDMHWADSTTVEFVAELLAAAEPGRFMLLLTSRQPPHDALTATGRLVEEPLGRLAPGDAAALARALDATRSLSAFEIAEIVEHSDGMPLYIEEFVRAIAAHAAGPDRIPITLRDSLMSVLDKLGTGRMVALCASVFGRRFGYEPLKALLGMSDDELQPALEALKQTHVLVQSSEFPEAWFEFRHALLRDTAYHTMLKSERDHWHRRVADLAATGQWQIKESMPELLAIHHSLGGNYQGAIEHWLVAQDQAMQRSANVEALTHIRSGLGDCEQLARQDPAQAARFELQLLRRLASPLIATSGWSTPELEGVYTRAMDLCRSVGSEDITFELERGLYNMHLLRSELRTADKIADRLLATAKAAQDARRRATLLLVALRSKALPAFYGGFYDEARRLLEEMLSLHDPLEHAGHAFVYGTEPAMLAHSYLAWMHAAAGDAAGARDHAARALQRARAVGHAFSIGYALCFAASCCQVCGDPAGAQDHAEEAARLGNRHNFQYWIAWARAILGWVTGLQAPDKGIALIDEARRSYLATGSSLVAPYFEALAVDVAKRLPDAGAAADESRLRARARETGVWFWECALRAPQTRAPRAAA